MNALNQAQTPQQQAGGGRAARRRRQRRRRARGAVQNGNLMVTAPVVGGAITRPRIPRITGGRESIIVQNTERFGVVPVSAAGATFFTRLDLVPCNLGWLNGVAQNYSKYRWISVHLYYIPSCATSTSGTVAYGLIYDNNDSVTGTTVALVQQVNRSVSGPVWAGYEGTSGLNSDSLAVPNGAMCVVVDVARFDKPYYKFATTTQIGGLPASDSGTYIPVSVLVATDGALAAENVGYIMAKYTIELIEPIPSKLNDEVAGTS